MGKKESKGPTPEDWARWRSNEERLYELANKGLAELVLLARSWTGGSAVSLRRIEGVRLAE